MRSKRDFLLGCLLPLALFAVLAGIALIGFRTAVVRSKQKHTLADLRTFDTAIAAYAEDHGQYPPAASFKRLVGIITPKYLTYAPQTDGWGTHYWYHCWKVDPVSRACDAYIIASAGADRQFQFKSGQQYQRRGIENAEEDLVYGRSSLRDPGHFIQYPKEMQVD